MEGRAAESRPTRLIARFPHIPSFPPLSASTSRTAALLRVPPRSPPSQVETIGDCYFVAGGLIREDEDGMAAVRDKHTDPLHAQKVFDFARVRRGKAAAVGRRAGRAGRRFRQGKDRVGAVKRP
jgi:hypothetical protein